MMLNSCSACLEKQRSIDKLQEELVRVKAKLRIQERKNNDGFFGSSTPSSKIPIKANSSANKKTKKKGAKLGHKGNGRKAFNEVDADKIVEISSIIGDLCPDCGKILENKGHESRMVVESPSMKPEKILYKLQKSYCTTCKQSFMPSAPSVLPKSLFGNQLISTAASMHYLHGIPMGRICEQTGIGAGTLVAIFHRLSRLFSDVPDKLIEQFKKSFVKHADETGWRTNGKNGYTWLFATDDISIFKFGKTRSASVPKAVFGPEPLPGVLVVDRYAGYNKVPCKIQYCYSHLLRDVQKLEKEFPEITEITAFVSTVASLLAQAIKLRTQDISDKIFLVKAQELKRQIQTAMLSPAHHLGIKYIQNIFIDNADRLYLWADDKRIPADNNRAERDLRPTVIARKVSFGSQSYDGAKTREVLMTILYTMRKRGYNATEKLKNVLDQLAGNMKIDTFELLFGGEANSG